MRFKVSLKKDGKEFEEVVIANNKKDAKPKLWRRKSAILLPYIPKKFLNVSAKKLTNKKKIKFFKKYIKNNHILDSIDDTIKVAIVTPDKDIIPDADTLNPAFIVFDNYEIILQWNRSLRFALAVCTLKNKFKNEIQ